ncbi:MAG: CpaF family protein [Lachnospira sp.]
MDELFVTLKNMVYERLDINVEFDDESLYEIIDECIHIMGKTHMLSLFVRDELRNRLYNAIKRLDILQELLEDDSITEIMVNGYKDIFIEKDGVVSRWNKTFESKEKLDDIAQRIAGMSNKTINEASPIVDTRLEDGSRVNIVLYPIALNGPIITIRKFYETPLDINKLISLGSITEEAADFLKKLVTAKYNIFISGGTGCGKTTFLNVLSNYIPKDERIITIEDSAELQIKGVDNLVRLEARTANTSGENGVTIRDLIKSSLRMRPDRIIVGEVRGCETIDMIQAMSSGHDGSLSTGHSNSPKDMLARLRTMILMGMDMPADAIDRQIASAIDIIVHLKRMRDKTRKVVEITEVGEYEQGQITLTPLYKFFEEGEDNRGRVKGCLKKQKNSLANIDKMVSSGIKEW